MIGLARSRFEAPGRRPGASLRSAGPSQSELNRRELFALVGSALAASTGTRTVRTSGVAETIAALAGPSPKPNPEVAPRLVPNLEAIPRPTAAGAWLRAERLLRFTISSRRVLRTVTRTASRTPSLSDAWERVTTRGPWGSLPGDGVDAAPPACAPGVGDSREIPGPTGSLGLSNPRARVLRAASVVRRRVRGEIHHEALVKPKRVFAANGSLASSPGALSAPDRHSRGAA